VPIEVRELVIKATIVQEGEEQGNSNSSSNNAISGNEEIINSCVERVVQIIRDKYGR